MRSAREPAPDNSFGTNKGPLVGDTFRNISNSTIVNRSLVEGAVNTLQQQHQQAAADAVEKVAELVAQSGNAEAIDYLDTFNEELTRPEPRKSILRSMWSGIVAAVPTITGAIGVVEAIEGLF